MRFNLKTATQFGGTSACTATVLAWLFGPVADPLVKQAAEQLDMWIMTWAELDPQERRETRRTWIIAPGEIFAGKKLTRPRGPVEATIDTLMQLGWKPGAPDHWTFNTSESVKLDRKAHTRFIVTARALHDAQGNVWKSAAKHAYSKGLETCIPSFEATRKAKRSFERNDLHKEAKALEAVDVGTYRPDKHEGLMGVCRRCAKRVRRGRWHDIYECADNDLIEHKAFKKATRFVKHAPPHRQPR